MEDNQPEAVSDSDESEVVVDVKVCDICGDAGEEDLLAICSRCTDGAEHTYCMRYKLQELPGDDWVCEECTLKDEMEAAKKCEPKVGDPVLCLNEDTSNSKISQELGSKIHDSGAHGASKEVDEKNDLKPRKKVPDTSELSIGAAISKAKSVLSRGRSFSFLEAGKLKQSTKPASSVAGNEVKKASGISKSFGRSSSTVRGQISHLTDSIKNVGGTSSVASSSTNTVLRRPAPRTDFTRRDDKIKDATFSDIRKKEALGGNRILHCKKCNEVGHTTDSCTIDKVDVFALKPSADRNLKEGDDKTSRWKEVLAAGSSRLMLQKNARLPNHSEKSSTYKAGDRCGFPSKDVRLESSSCQDSLKPPIIGPNKRAAAVDENLHAVQKVEASFSLRPSCSDPTVAKSLPQTLPSEASVPNIPRASVVPELEFIWQGGFEVLRSGRLHKFCDGFQAHLATSASPKVLDVATKLPGNVQLEEVTRVSSWPSQFQGRSPAENNIGLFFFAKDLQSYAKDYGELVDVMIKNDLALKGNIDGAELLVFPSNKLPANSQRWNRLFYLWGVFVGKRSSSETVSNYHEKVCTSSSEPSVQALQNPSKRPIRQELYSHDKPDVKVDGSKVMEVGCINSLDHPPILSSGITMNDTQLSTGATNGVSLLKSGLAATGNVNLQSCEEMEGSNVKELCLKNKRPQPTFVEATSHDSDENLRSSTKLKHLNMNVLPPDDGKGNKKIKSGSKGEFDLDLNSPVDVDPIED